MDEQAQQLIERLQSANNILVTVSNDPSVDQLAACIGLTLAVNKLGKHGTAVFSGRVPDTIDFLKPEETLEKNTDSLRDFIIALDKSKADKLRYKVEDRVVKIFITPYRTSISADDLDFSQGDFNVDLVVALGVHEQTQLDQAITSHGRILHDATVASITNTTDGGLGSIHWQDTRASSLSEMVASLLKRLDKKLLDQQMATALLTGIVAATDRFRGDNTSASTMNASADLMSAGANQQLVTSQLEHAMSVQGPAGDDQPSDDADSNGSEDASEKGASPSSKSNDGTLEINHDDAGSDETQPDQAPPQEDFKLPTPEPMASDTPPVAEDDLPKIGPVRGTPNESVPDDQPPASKPHRDDHRDLMTQPPTLGGTLTANSRSEDDLPDRLENPLENQKTPDEPLLSHNHDPAADTKPAAEPPLPPRADMPSPTPPKPDLFTPPTPPQPPLPPAPEPTPSAEPLPHPEPDASPVAGPPPSNQSDIDAARNEVMRALSEQSNESALPPIAALNAQPLGGDLHVPTPAVPPTAPQRPPVQPPVMPSYQPDSAPAEHSPADQPMDMPLPPAGGLNVPPPQSKPPTNTPSSDPNAPPPVPPPMMPPNNWPPK